MCPTQLPGDDHFGPPEIVAKGRVEAEGLLSSTSARADPILFLSHA
jgi:hypothetical protein